MSDQNEILSPPTGETPLTQAWYDQLHRTPTRGGSDAAAQQWAFLDFQKQFGRNPTQSELSSLSPAYSIGDANLLDFGRGKQAIAQYFQNQSNTPDKIAKSNRDKYLKEAPQHFGSINQQFQTNLGRAASQDELNHFGLLISAGSLDPYQLQTFLQQQPEYQQTQNKTFQNELSGQLAGYDKQYFNESILPSIQQAYAKQGRSFDSSAFQAAATNSAQQQNVERQKYLAGISAQQYGNTQANAYNDYTNMVGNQQNLTNAGINAQYQGNIRMQDRLNQISDFNTQQQAYNQYLAKYGKRNNGLGGLIGGGIGAIAGGYFGGVQGAGPGYQMGTGFGQAGQNAYGGSY